MQLTLWKIDETGKPYRGGGGESMAEFMLECSIEETSIPKRK